MGNSGRRWVLLVVQIAVAVGLLTLVWRLVDGGEALQLLSQANMAWVIAAVAVLSFQIVLSALRWQITAGQLGITLDRGSAIREYYLSQIINQTLPGGVLGDAGRAVRARSHAGLWASGQAVVLERLAGQVGLLIVLSGAFVVTLTVPGGLEWPGWLATLVAILISLALIVPLVMSGFARLLPPRSRQFITELLSSARRALAGKKTWVVQLVLSLATALANIAGVVFCARALGVDLSFGVAMAIVPLILFTMLVPITVSGWGLREAAAIALFPLAGLSATEGLATSVAFGVVLLVIALPGLWFLRRSPQSVRA
jgi:glycosyltransferase 2 family protein